MIAKINSRTHIQTKLLMTQTKKVCPLLVQRDRMLGKRRSHEWFDSFSRLRAQTKGAHVSRFVQKSIFFMRQIYHPDMIGKTLKNPICFAIIYKCRRLFAFYLYRYYK